MIHAGAVDRPGKVEIHVLGSPGFGFPKNSTSRVIVVPSLTVTSCRVVVNSGGSMLSVQMSSIGETDVRV
jgi:hypothetical protein